MRLYVEGHNCRQGTAPEAAVVRLGAQEEGVAAQGLPRLRLWRGHCWSTATSTMTTMRRARVGMIATSYWRCNAQRSSLASRPRRSGPAAST